MSETFHFQVNLGGMLDEAGLPWTIGLWNQKKLYDFYKGVWTVLHQLKKNTDTIKLELPKQFRLYQEDGFYSIEELESWIYAQTADIARRFDQRNGNSYFAEDFSLSQKEPLNCKIKSHPIAPDPLVLNKRHRRLTPVAAMEKDFMT